MKRIKVKEGENLSADNIEKVISLLNGEKPITKKAACEILNISYNTTRLDSIISNHIEQKEYEVKRRAELRKQPISTTEEKIIVESYIAGNSIASISEETFRSRLTIQKVLKKYKLPILEERKGYIMLEPEQISSEYQKGDLVFSTKYNVPAYIVKQYSDEVFQIWLLGDNGQYAYQPNYELIDLREAQMELGVKIDTMDMSEINNHIAIAFQNAKKGMKDNVQKDSY